MNLLFRLLWISLFARFSGACDALGPCLTSFRVMPSDLDVFRHMNNGRYFSVFDLARVDLMIRSGLFSQLKKKGWYPVVVSETINFRKSLQLFDRFDVETRVLGWDERAILLQHRVLRSGQEITSAVIRARFLKRSGGGVSPGEILALAGRSDAVLVLPEWVQRWNADQIVLQAKGSGGA